MKKRTEKTYKSDREKVAEANKSQREGRKNARIEIVARGKKKKEGNGLVRGGEGHKIIWDKHPRADKLKGRIREGGGTCWPVWQRGL